MTQRIFDVENEKDYADLWDIVPDNITKIRKAYKSEEDCFINFYDTKHIEGFYITNFLNINWHDKTEITRPIQEATEPDIGKWCCFWDNCSEDVMIGKLSVIVQDRGKPSYRLGGYAVFDHARRLTKQEIEELC
jgi:hypothetical protein